MLKISNEHDDPSVAWISHTDLPFELESGKLVSSYMDRHTSIAHFSVMRLLIKIFKIYFLSFKILTSLAVVDWWTGVEVGDSVVGIVVGPIRSNLKIFVLKLHTE